MKREPSTTDSFDLFLDTICNTFGGVVFLAILLAILIQTRAIIPDHLKSEESPVTPQQARELSANLESAKSNYDAIQISLDQLPSMPDAPKDLEYVSMVAERDSLEEQAQASIEALAAETAKFGQQLEKNAELQQANAKVPIELEKLKNEVRAKQQAFESLVGNRQSTFNVPRERDSQSASALVLMRHSRFFVAKIPSSTARDFNDSQVTTRSGLGSGITIVPKIGSGWENEDQSVESFVRTMQSSGYVITIAVWPDSFGEFETIKRLLIDTNISYQLWPQRPGEELTVFLGAGQTRVQ